MAFLQGDPLPSVTTTTTRSQEAPSYYTDYLSGLSQAGQTALQKTPQQLVAGLDPLQMQAYAQVPEAAEAYRPGLEAAQQTAASAATGVTPERIAQFMNPYTQNVVNEMERLSQQAMQRSLLPTLKAGFVGTGGLGGRRYASALGQSLADVEANLAGRQYGALSEGYKTALDTALREAQLEREAATTQGNLAKTAQELGLGEVGALSKAGTERQAYEQAMIDAPLKAAQAAQGLLRGFTIPTGDVSTVVGPGQAGQYGLSDLQKTMGLLSAIGALTAPGVGTGSTTTQGVQGAQANAGLDYLLSGIRRMLPSVAPTYFQDAAGNWMSGDVTSQTPPI